MSSRLAFQTQLASIMEVLANAAVAEICKLVDDDYAVVSLQMSQCQRENKALKRKLHLLELKMARGTAERRLRESALNNSRLRVHVSGIGNDRVREASPSADGGFDQQTVSMWPNRALTASVPEQSDHTRSESPDVQLVEPEPVIVKEETETKLETKEEVHLIEDNGIMECSPHVPERPKHSFEISPSASRTRTPPRAPRRNSAANRGVEEDGEPDVVLVKVEEAEVKHNQTGLIIQEVSSCQTQHTPGLEKQTGAMAHSLQPHCLVESSTDDIKASSTNQLQDSLPTISELDSRLHHTPLISSEFSLSELETFFTRWAPDTDPTAAPGGSFVHNVSAESEKDAVIIVENGQETTRAQTQPQTTMSQASSVPSPSSSIQSIHSQTPWMRAAMLRNTQILHQNRAHSNISITPTTSLPASSSEPLSSIKIGLQHSTSSMPQGFLSSHMYRKPKKFTCKVCGKAFPGWSNLEAHERVHTGEKPFVCNTCGKRFSESGNLKKHQRVHTGEKPFSCEKCGKKFAWICNLRTHQQSATGCGVPVTQGTS